jgi:hypothetical protein
MSWSVTAPALLGLHPIRGDLDSAPLRLALTRYPGISRIVKIPLRIETSGRVDLMMSPVAAEELLVSPISFIEAGVKASVGKLKLPTRMLWTSHPSTDLALARYPYITATRSTGC